MMEVTEVCGITSLRQPSSPYLKFWVIWEQNPAVLLPPHLQFSVFCLSFYYLLRWLLQPTRTSFPVAFSHSLPCCLLPTSSSWAWLSPLVSVALGVDASPAPPQSAPSLALLPPSAHSTWVSLSPFSLHSFTWPSYTTSGCRTLPWR